jgi:hypothetical protein
MRRELRHYRIGLAPVLLTKEANALRRAAYRRLRKGSWHSRGWNGIIWG